MPFIHLLFQRSSKKAACLASFLATVLTASIVLAGPPFRTDDPEPVGYRHWEFYLFSQATHVKGDTSGVLPGLDVNYGIVPDAHLHFAASLEFDKTSKNGFRSGYGDTEIGIKYRFIKEDGNGRRPQAGIFPALELPTGDKDRGFGAGRARAFFPLWLQKDFGPWTTYGGGGYWIHPGDGNKDYWFVGWTLMCKVTGKLNLGGEIFYQTADTVGGASSTGFNLGGIYDLTGNHHLLFSAGRGIQNTTATNAFSYYAGYQLTF